MELLCSLFQDAELLVTSQIMQCYAHDILELLKRFLKDSGLFQEELHPCARRLRPSAH